MKILFSILFLLVLQFFVSAQKNCLMNIDQLNNRVKNGKDTTFIINFWATWCAPCIKELSNFEKFNEAYKTEKVKVLLVSVDYTSKINSALIPFIKRKNIKSEVFLLNETNQQEYIDRIDASWSGSVPATLFIKNGKRKFIEQEFTYHQLITEYKSIQ